MTGLGNIYVDEVLYKSKINPYRKSSTLSYQEVETVLNYSIEEVMLKRGKLVLKPNKFEKIANKSLKKYWTYNR